MDSEQKNEGVEEKKTDTLNQKTSRRNLGEIIEVEMILLKEQIVLLQMRLDKLISPFAKHILEVREEMKTLKETMDEYEEIFDQLE